jgi:hypothetical protein
MSNEVFIVIIVFALVVLTTIDLNELMAHCQRYNLEFGNIRKV